MKTIWKFPVDMLSAQQQIAVGDNARVIHVEVQQNTPCFWVEHDIQGHLTTTTIMLLELVGTGGEVPPESTYVGSFQLGSFVFHLYDLDLGAR